MTVTFARFALALLVLPTLCGCALFEAHSSHIEFCGQLNDGSQVILSQERHSRVWDRSEESSRTKLQLFIVEPDGKIAWEGLVASRDGAPDAPTVFDFGKLEGRRSSDAMRLWIIERSKRRVVVALDRNQDQLYGLHEPPPAWAAPNAGVELRACGEE